MNYQEEIALRSRRHPLIVRMLDKERHPYSFGILKALLFPVLWPFRKRLRRLPGGRTGWMGKLLRQKKFREALQFGESLFDGELSNTSQPAGGGKLAAARREARRFEWWGTFQAMCDSFYWLEDSEGIKKIESKLLNAPGTEGVESEAVRGYLALARLYWKSGDEKRVFQLIEESLQIDGTHAEAVVMKAWAQMAWDQGNPVDTLVHAVELDSAVKLEILRNERLKDYPDYRRALLERTAGSS